MERQPAIAARLALPQFGRRGPKCRVERNIMGAPRGSRLVT